MTEGDPLGIWCTDSLEAVVGIKNSSLATSQIRECNSGRADEYERLFTDDLRVNEDFELEQITNKEYRSKFAAK